MPKAAALNALQYQLLDRLPDVAPTDWIGAVKAVEDEMHAKEKARLAKADGAARAAKSQPSLPRSATTASTRIRGTASPPSRHAGGKQMLTFRARRT
jgi:hypothetical protein